MLKRWLIAFAAAIVLAIVITLLITRATRPIDNWSDEAVAIWKDRTGVDLTTLPQQHPAEPDNEEARTLDALLRPIGLRLGGRVRNQVPPEWIGDDEGLQELQDAIRDKISSATTQARALPSSAATAIDHRAVTLDEVAKFVETHDDIRWREDFEPRAQVSRIYVSEHLALHRLLIGRAFLQLERGDQPGAERMFATSVKLRRALERRQELRSHMTAVGIERMQLALMRSAGGSFGQVVATDDIRTRFVNAMSAEAVVTIANANAGARPSDENDPAVQVIRVMAKPKLQIAARELLKIAAQDIADITRAQDACAEVARRRIRPHRTFANDFFTLNAPEAWRLFVVLALDRAITAAVLTGRTSSPCPTVSITVRDEQSTRTVSTTGLPELPDNLVALPAVLKAPLAH